MPDSHSPVFSDDGPACTDCANFILGEPRHLRLRIVCPTCKIPLRLHDRYEISRKISGSWDANAEVFVVFDNQESHVQKVLKVLTNQELHVLSLFKVEQTILMELEHPGIPKGYDAFDIPVGQDASIPCVVMEKIQGETLQDYLNHQGPIDQEMAIDWMRQLTHILGYIHSQRLFHRDVKLTNIMRREQDGTLVLIDFGTSRHITQTIVNGGQNTVVFSYGYTAPEQLAGKAEMRSDFYALGRTFLHLLMGELPSEWRTFSAKHQISNSFIKLLKDLTEDDVSKRPRTAKVILNRLQRISHEPQTKQLKRMAWVFSGGLVCGSILMTPVMMPLLHDMDWEKIYQKVFPAPTCDTVMNDRVSCGEEIFIRSLKEGKSVPDKKEEGTRLMREGKYRDAYQAFKVAFEEQKDPETLIYLNNAKVHSDPTLNKDRVTIAAVVPIGREEAKSRAMAILRGIAQAQDDAVNKLKRGIEVVIVDDNNSQDRSKAAAIAFTKRSQILAGVGHSSSDALISALPIYQAQKLVFIAPASTSEDFSGAALEKDHIFFRSLASNRINAMHVNRLLLLDLKQKKVALYYNPDSPYSRSLASAFREASEPYNIEIIDDPQGNLLISNSTFDAQKALKYSRSQGATAHILIPDAGVSRNGVDNALRFVRENQGEDWLIAGDSLAGMPEYLSPEYGPLVQGKMIFSAAWDVSDDPKSPLIQFWKDDRIPQESSVDWRTFTSYNATWILATALNDSAVRSRERLQKKLSEPTFKADTVSGELRFRERSGELAKPNITLTTIKQCGDRYRTVNFYKPICPPDAPNSPPKTP